ncbi:ABC transporter ATP-binding protein [Corynebacterium ulceribovis]|uniref:ABC transporter ATP-binding protein n=1 Tax=Corynebacterium ulceribovis TaxID=487732 RepID=UPI0003607F4A|nr:ABC transporter ATP-binding protein [Corynebacterium ulceribovis]
MITLTSVSRSYEDGPTTINALVDVSLTVSPGELVAVMGPSGSGKSTLLKIAGLLEQPSSGTVTINGTDTTNMSKNQLADLRRDRIGFVFQDFNLIPTLTVAENVALPLELARASRGQVKDAAHQALEEVGIAELANRFPADISGGQAQRVAIARALIGERSAILADEPTGALDSTTAEGIMRLIREKVDAGAAGLLVTHEPRFAAWADRTIYLADGAIRADDGARRTDDGAHAKGQEQ